MNVFSDKSCLERHLLALSWGGKKSYIQDKVNSPINEVESFAIISYTSQWATGRRRAFMYVGLDIEYPKQTCQIQWQTSSRQETKRYLIQRQTSSRPGDNSLINAGDIFSHLDTGAPNFVAVFSDMTVSRFSPMSVRESSAHNKPALRRSVDWPPVV